MVRGCNHYFYVYRRFSDFSLRIFKEKILKASPRLSERLRQFRERSRKLVLEEIIVYSAVIGIDLCYDFARHCMDIFINRGVLHPIEFGIGQIFVLVAFSAMLWRKCQQLEEYR